MHKDIASTVVGYRPVSSRLISIRIGAAPFNITIIQVYAPTSGHDDSAVDHSYQQLQETIDKTPKKDILFYKGIRSLKLGRMHRQTVEAFFGSCCNVETNERGLEFTTLNSLVLTNTLGPHKPFRR